MSWALDPLPVMSSVGSVCVGQMWSAENATDASLVTLDFHAAGVSSFQWLISLSEVRDLNWRSLPLARIGHLLILSLQSTKKQLLTKGMTS